MWAVSRKERRMKLIILLLVILSVFSGAFLGVFCALSYHMRQNAGKESESDKATVKQSKNKHRHLGKLSQSIINTYDFGRYEEYRKEKTRKEKD